MSFKSFFAGFFIAAILCGGVVVFAFPEILETESSDEDKSNILQREIITSSSPAYIGDVNTTDWIDVPDMDAIITTAGNSFLVLSFSTPYALQMGITFIGGTRFNISLGVNGIGNHIGRIGYYSTWVTGFFEIHGTFFLNFETDVLPASNYSIEVSWVSEQDATGDNTLYFNYPAGFNLTRTLSVWEVQA